MTGRLALVRRARIVWDAHESVHFLLWPERGLRLNDTASMIVSMCDGTRTADELAADCVTAYSESPSESIRDEVVAFLTELTRRGLVRAL